MCICVRLRIGRVDELQRGEEGRKIRPAGRRLRRLVLRRDVVFDCFKSVAIQPWIPHSAACLRSPTCLQSSIAVVLTGGPGMEWLKLSKARVVIGCLRNQFGRHAGLAATARAQPLLLPQPQHLPHLPSSLEHAGSPMLDQHKLRGKTNLRHAGEINSKDRIPCGY